VPEPLATLNVFRLLLRRPALAKGTADLLLSMLAGSVLDARLRELVIMRVAWTTKSTYEWAQHYRIATDVGVSEGDLTGVRDTQRWSFEPHAAAVIRAADEVVGRGEVESGTVDLLRGLLGDDAALEVVAAAATWTMVSTLLRTFRVPLDPDLVAWPPDGRGPDSLP